MYLFNDRTAQTYFPKMPGFQPLAYHTADIPYVFTGYHGGPQGVPFTLTPAQSQLSDRMVDSLGEFRAHRQSQRQGRRALAALEERRRHPAYLLQDNDWKTVQTNAQFAAAHNCAFWNKHSSLQIGLRHAPSAFRRPAARCSPSPAHAAEIRVIWRPALSTMPR